MEKEILMLIEKQNKILDVLIDKVNQSSSSCSCSSHTTSSQLANALLEETLISKGLVDSVKNRIKNPIKWDEDEQV